MKWFRALAGLWWLKTAYLAGMGYEPVTRWDGVLACASVGIWLLSEVVSELLED